MTVPRASFRVLGPAPRTYRGCTRRPVPRRLRDDCHTRAKNEPVDPNTNFDFGSKDYSREELVAELGSAFLCAEAHIDNSVIDNNTAYLNSWLKALQDDKKLIIFASAKAGKAVDYIRNLREGN